MKRVGVARFMLVAAGALSVSAAGCSKQVPMTTATTSVLYGIVEGNTVKVIGYAPQGAQPSEGACPEIAVLKYGGAEDSSPEAAAAAERDNYVRFPAGFIDRTKDKVRDVPSQCEVARQFDGLKEWRVRFPWPCEDGGCKPDCYLTTNTLPAGADYLKCNTSCGSSDSSSPYKCSVCQGTSGRHADAMDNHGTPTNTADDTVVDTCSYTKPGTPPLPEWCNDALTHPCSF